MFENQEKTLAEIEAIRRQNEWNKEWDKHAKTPK